MLLSILTSTVLAFAPSTTTWIGVEPNRLVTFNSVTQDRLRQGNDIGAHFISKYPTWKGVLMRVVVAPIECGERGFRLIPPQNQQYLADLCHFWNHMISQG